MSPMVSPAPCFDSTRVSAMSSTSHSPLVMKYISIATSRALKRYSPSPKKVGHGRRIRTQAVSERLLVSLHTIYVSFLKEIFASVCLAEYLKR
jgi:hypothetical protein